MKRILLLIGLALLPLSTFSQSIFDKYEDLDAVTSVVVNKSMFRLLAKLDVNVDDPEAQEYMDMAKSIESLKVFTTDDQGVAQDMAQSVSEYLTSASLEELMRVKDEKANIKFYIKEGKDEDHVSELLMFITGIKEVKLDKRRYETVLLSITGDIDLNKISSLTQQMNLPEELNKVGKSKE